VKVAAMIGMTGLHKVGLSTVSKFSSRRFNMFDALEEARNFLADY
jgi:hypothetical protein